MIDEDCVMRIFMSITVKYLIIFELFLFFLRFFREILYYKSKGVGYKRKYICVYRYGYFFVLFLRWEID